jgi:hypothetical protein
MFLILVGANLSTGANRALGDLKVSWKWASAMQFSQNLVDQRVYKQVLAQVNFYMDQHNARHGSIVSNIEFVAVKRLDRDGRLARYTGPTDKWGCWPAFSVARIMVSWNVSCRRWSMGSKLA